MRNELVHNLLKRYWSACPRGGYHKRCYQTCTRKRNMKYPLKRKMDDNVKVPVTSKPGKVPRTYNSPKCVLCLEDKQFADRKYRTQLRQCLTEDGVSSLKRTVPNNCFLVKLELGYVFNIIKHAKRLWQGFFTKLMRTWKIYQIMRNQ
jgi:hypothetical protein